MTPRLLDLDELAAMLKVPPRQAAELYRRGAFPGIKLSYKTLRFDPADVLRALKKENGRSHGKQSTT
jgi:hypothetical protein